MTEAAFSYCPGVPCYAATFSRGSVAYQVESPSRAVFLLWPGQLHMTATASRASVAYQVHENKYPESD